MPPAVQDLLHRFLQLAKELEPYVQGRDENSVHVDYRQGAWTEAMLAQFRQEIYPYPAAVQLLEYAAENAGREVN